MKILDLTKERFSGLLPMWLLIMLVAIWSVVIQDGHINRDGLLYLKQAYLIAEGSWKEGLALYPWPFFSILIAIFHKITGLHLQVVAHAVDLALFGIAAWFYLKTLKFIYKQKHIIFYGGIILLSFIPIIDDYVGMVLRDHGLWAGCMMGTYFYFKNFKEYSLRNSITWQFGFLFAGLFRPEGLIFLLLLPLWNLSQNKSQKFKKLVQDYSLSILLLIFGLLVFVATNVDLVSLINSSRLNEFVNRPLQFFNQLVKPLPIQTDNKYLSNLFENYSLIITYAVLISVLFFKWTKGMGLLHGGLFFYSFFTKKKTINNYQKHIYFFLAVSFILVSINLFNVYVLTNRYWGFHWFWIFIFIAPKLCYVFEQDKIIFIFKILLTMTFIFMIFVSLHDRSEDIEMDVARYLKINRIYNINFKNNERIRYYVDKNVGDLVVVQKLKKNEYTITNFPKNGKIKLGTIIKNFPENKPKYILLKND